MGNTFSFKERCDRVHLECSGPEMRGQSGGGCIGALTPPPSPSSSDSEVVPLITKPITDQPRSVYRSYRYWNWLPFSFSFKYTQGTKHHMYIYSCHPFQRWISKVLRDCRCSNKCNSKRHWPPVKPIQCILDPPCCMTHTQRGEHGQICVPMRQSRQTIAVIHQPKDTKQKK